MARQYSAFYDAKKSTNSYINTDDEAGWQVIVKDYDEDIWYVEVPDAGDRESALRLAEALNMREREYEKNF